MKLAPDVYTDLVILYHAGEASQATRRLLEEEAQSNPAVAAALRAVPRTIAPLPAAPQADHRRALRSARNHFALLVAYLVCLFALGAIAVRYASNTTNVALMANALPFLLLLTIWVAAFLAFRFFRKWF
jgi:ferric-dicitrate binding protein FerR (iron transport regulator)